MNTSINYRTFSELLDEVSLDFKTYSQEGLIESAQLIKIALKVNYDLGLRIHSTKNAILDISHGKAKLPDDFYVLDHALLCYKNVRYQVNDLKGTHREDVLVGCIDCCSCKPDTDDPCTTVNENCICNKVYTNPCGESYVVVEKKGLDVTIFEEFEHIRLTLGKHVDKNCLNTQVQSKYMGEIKNGYLYTNLNHGKIYISYQGAMEDDEGNLLVLDHPMINEYYEYSLKERILENLYIDGEDVERKMGLISERLRVARNNAWGIVNTPDFKEIKEVFDMNRKAQYKKYYSMFV